MLFRSYKKEKSVIDRKFVIKPVVFQIPQEDLEVFKSDWALIQKKVIEGKAHEISEGDTFFLGACTKGPGKNKVRPRTQPNSDIRAKSRAFSIKQGYLSRIVRGLDEKNQNAFLEPNLSFEEATIKRFSSFIGKSVEELSAQFGLQKINTSYPLPLTMVKPVDCFVAAVSLVKKDIAPLSAAST